MAEYTYREAGCDRCGTEEIETIENEKRGSLRPPTVIEHLCCFCYETHLGNILDYPRQYPELQTVVTGLIQAFHILKREIKGTKS